MTGLKICTRCRANSARRRRRISSSLLPENIGPTTTSIQPIFPLTMSRLFAPVGWWLVFAAGRGRGAGPPRIIEWRKGCDEGNTKGILARDAIRRKDTPGALRVADSRFAGEAVDGLAELGAIDENLVGENLGDFDGAGAPELAALAIADISPALEENALDAIFLNGVQSTFKADKIVPVLVFPGGKLFESFRSLARTLHRLHTRMRSVADAACDFAANDLKFGGIVQERSDFAESVIDSAKLGLAGTADRNDDFLRQGCSRGDCTWTEKEKVEGIRGSEENSCGYRMTGGLNADGVDVGAVRRRVRSRAAPAAVEWSAAISCVHSTRKVRHETSGGRFR